MPKSPIAEALEIINFRLAAGVSMKDFIAANQDVDAWLEQQPGFILRRVSQNANGIVTDMLLWTSVMHAERAVHGIVTELAGSPVHAAIDQSTVDWSVTRCLHRVK